MSVFIYLNVRVLSWIFVMQISKCDHLRAMCPKRGRAPRNIGPAMLRKAQVVVAAFDAAEEHVIGDHWHDILIHELLLAAHALAAICAAEDQAMAVFDDILAIHLLARTATAHSEAFCFFLLQATRPRSPPQ